jgi:hypothetical protein
VDSYHKLKRSSDKYCSPSLDSFAFFLFIFFLFRAIAAMYIMRMISPLSKAIEEQVWRIRNSHKRLNYPGARWRIRWFGPCARSSHTRVQSCKPLSTGLHLIFFIRHHFYSEKRCMFTEEWKKIKSIPTRRASNQIQDQLSLFRRLQEIAMLA